MKISSQVKHHIIFLLIIYNFHSHHLMQAHGTLSTGYQDDPDWVNLTSCPPNLICSGVPPEVALVMAQAASFLVLNSAFCRMSIRTGKMLASMTVCGAAGDER